MSEDPIATLTRTVVDGLNGINSRLDAQDRVLEKVANEGVETNTRLTRVEVRMDGAEARMGDIEGRIGRTSLRVGQVSESDLVQEAKLAAEIQARQELAAKVNALDAKQDTQLAILSRLDKVTSNPQVKIIIAILVTALVQWAASRGINIK